METSGQFLSLYFISIFVETLHIIALFRFYCVTLLTLPV